MNAIRLLAIGFVLAASSTFSYAASGARCGFAESAKDPWDDSHTYLLWCSDSHQDRDYTVYAGDAWIRFEDEAYLGYIVNNRDYLRVRMGSDAASVYTVATGSRNAVKYLGIGLGSVEIQLGYVFSRDSELIHEVVSGLGRGERIVFQVGSDAPVRYVWTSEEIGPLSNESDREIAQSKRCMRTNSAIGWQTIRTVVAYRIPLWRNDFASDN
jgi:hypothetical protein